MNRFYIYTDVLREAAGGLGAIALSCMLGEQASFAAEAGPLHSYDLKPETATFPSKSEERHLHLHQWWTEHD